MEAKHLAGQLDDHLGDTDPLQRYDVKRVRIYFGAVLLSHPHLGSQMRKTGIREMVTRGVNRPTFSFSF